VPGDVPVLVSEDRAGGEEKVYVAIASSYSHVWKFDGGEMEKLRLLALNVLSSVAIKGYNLDLHWWTCIQGSRYFTLDTEALDWEVLAAEPPWPKRYGSVERCCGRSRGKRDRGVLNFIIYVSSGQRRG
jgi:hypothetical protein